MTNALATPQVFANTGLMFYKNNLVLARTVSNDYTKEFKSKGDTVKAKRPPEFLVGNGRVAKNQDVVEGSVDIKLTKQKHIKVKFTSVEETLSVDSLLHSKTLEAAMGQLAQQVDSDGMSLYRSVPNWAGTPGQNIDSPSDFFEGPLRLDNMAVPSVDRQGVLYPKDYFKLAGYFTSTTQAGNNQMGQDAIQHAKIPMIGDVQPYKTQSIITHVNGTWGGSPAVKGAGQNVTYDSVKDNYVGTLKINGVTNGGTLKVGDVFTIAGVYAINPRSKAQLDYLQQFVVRPGTDGSGGYAAATLTDVDGSTYTDTTNGTWTFSTSGSSDITLNVVPPMITSGAYQTVSAAPADGAAITLQGSVGGSYPQNMVYHRSAFTLVTADLIMPVPGSGEAAYAHDDETGLSIRYWRYSSGDNDEHAHRFDVLYDWTCLDPRLAARLSGTA